MDSNTELEKELQEKLEELSPMGTLFDTITYYSVENLDQFLENMNQQQAIYCLTEAVKAAYRRGSFRLEESEAISKAIRVLGVD
jgi:hypothetical protein